MISVRRSRPILILSVFAAVSAIAWLVTIMAREPLNLTDFRYIWLAGVIWHDGGNPYAAEFITRSVNAFGAGNQLSVWVYPFNWFLPATALALFPAETAFRIWQVVLLGLAGFSGWCVYRIMPPGGVRDNARTPWILIFFCVTTTAVSGLLRSGQPALVAISGLALMLHASQSRNRAVMILGLVLVAFKPQFGLLVFAAVVSRPRGILICTLAVCWIAGLTIFVLLSSSASAQILSLLNNLGGNYQALPVNDPSRLIALPQIIFALSAIRVPIGIMVLATTVFVFVCGVAIRFVGRNGAFNPDTACISLAVICVCFGVGVHGSDLAALLLLLPLALACIGGLRWLAVAGYLLLWRAENLTRALHWSGPIGLGTISVCLVALAFALFALSTLRQLAVQPRSDRPFDPAVE